MALELERLQNEMKLRDEKHSKLVEEYNSKISEKRRIEKELDDIEKEIVKNQGAMEVINTLGVELMESQNNAEPVQPEVITE